MKILVIAGQAGSLINFRGHLLAAFKAKGFEVHVAAPNLLQGSLVREQLEAKGIITHSFSMSRTGTNPLNDICTLWQLWRLMLYIVPTHMLAYTIKPVIYGSLAAQFAGVPNRYALITGLGYAFQGDVKSRGILRAVVQRLYSLALRFTTKVFFQNPDDEALFVTLGLLQKNTPRCIVNGSGVDVELFAMESLPTEPHFLLIGRLLGDKGVREYANAAQHILKIYPNVKFSLVGGIDENPDSIAQSEIDGWVQQGVLNYLGYLDDVRHAIAKCNVFVLPSYREGTPRTVLEAMAMGRAVITTDAPGCRETVIEGYNGFLVTVKSIDDLTNEMTKFIADASLAHRMGKCSRKLVEEKYDVHKVNSVMLREMGL